MADDLTDEEIERKFTAMGHSVTEINEIITEEQPTEYIRGRHPTHLERHNNDPEMLKEVKEELENWVQGFYGGSISNMETDVDMSA